MGDGNENDVDDELFHDEIQDLYKRESQITKSPCEDGKRGFGPTSARGAFESHWRKKTQPVTCGKAEEIGIFPGPEAHGQEMQGDEDWSKKASEVSDADGEDLSWIWP